MICCPCCASTRPPDVRRGARRPPLGELARPDAERADLAVPGPLAEGTSFAERRESANLTAGRRSTRRRPAGGTAVTTTTKRIGLSLGADICWPICFEEILRRLTLRIPSRRRDRVASTSSASRSSRSTCASPCSYDMVIDRLTHWYHTSREWIKKAVVLNDLVRVQQPVVDAGQWRSTRPTAR